MADGNRPCFGSVGLECYWHALKSSSENAGGDGLTSIARPSGAKRSAGRFQKTPDSAMVEERYLVKA